MTPNPSATQPLFSTCIPSFVAAARAERSLSEATIAKYETATRTFVAIVGDMAVQDITFETFVRLKRVLTERGSGSSHINGVIYAVRRVLDHCRTHLDTPVLDLSRLTMMRVPRRTVVHLTPDELERFMDSIRVHTRTGAMHLPRLCFRALVEVLAGTGMRIAEALSLDVAGIDWRNHDARIIGKGGKERKVFFSDRSLRWLKRYVEIRGSRAAALFVSPATGRRLSRLEAERWCRQVRRRAGMEKRVTLHVLRHTFATTLLRNGCPIGHIQGLLGHDRLETTCRYYLGLLEENDLKRAHEKFLDW